MLALAAPIVFARRAPVKVVVLTTSYPRDERDVAGLFVRDAVEAVRARGRGGRGRLAGVVPPLRDRLRPRDRREPAPAAVARAAAAGVPLQLRAGGAAGGARRRPRPRALAPVRRSPRSRPGSRSSSSSGAPTSSSRGARRGSSGRSLRRARLAIAASEFLADAARELGAREVRVIPSGVEIPETVGEPDEPPHVLFVGRLSPEKGILEFLEATEGLPRVIVGAGPVRRVPRRSASSRRRARRRTTSARRSSASRRGARATASSRARRWRTAGRWSRRASAGSSTSPASSSRRATSARLREVLERAARRRGLARAPRRGGAGETAREQLGAGHRAGALTAVYERVPS